MKDRDQSKQKKDIRKKQRQGRGQKEDYKNDN